MVRFFNMYIFLSFGVPFLCKKQQQQYFNTYISHLYAYTHPLQSVLFQLHFVWLLFRLCVFFFILFCPDFVSFAPFKFINAALESKVNAVFHLVRHECLTQLPGITDKHKRIHIHTFKHFLTERWIGICI